jgi:hypothetical protein
MAKCISEMSAAKVKKLVEEKLAEKRANDSVVRTFDAHEDVNEKIIVKACDSIQEK